MKTAGNKILITGGASGIGLGLAERFLHENNTVIICGRREDVLKQITDKHPQVIAKACDLTKEAERIELHNWIFKKPPRSQRAGEQRRHTELDARFRPGLLP